MFNHLRKNSSSMSKVTMVASIRSMKAYMTRAVREFMLSYRIEALLYCDANLRRLSLKVM